MGNGKKYRYFAPVKDKSNPEDYAKIRFVKKQFDVNDFVNNKGIENGKHVITPIEGKDLLSNQSLEGTQVFFYYPHCVASFAIVKKADSIASTGVKVMLIATTSEYERIDKLLKNTAFYKQPYYVIENKKYSNIVIRKTVNFIREMCAPCYEKYKDELDFADHLLIGENAIEIIM
jgi:hypothetical protein